MRCTCFVQCRLRPRRFEVTSVVFSEGKSPNLRYMERDLQLTILSDSKLFQDWMMDLVEMSNRIKDMRKALYETLVDLGTPGQWDHIVSQVSLLF